jgi:hypothetical protein
MVSDAFKPWWQRTVDGLGKILMAKHTRTPPAVGSPPPKRVGRTRRPELSRMQVSFLWVMLVIVLLVLVSLAFIFER